MSASNRTPNYNLPQFSSTDKPSWLGDFNAAMLAIDTVIKNQQAAIDTLTLAQSTQATEIATNIAAIAALTTRVNNANTQLRALGQPGI